MDRQLKQRLLPLYIASFSQGLVFWYAIEKVFMTNIGFRASSIVLITIIWSVTGLLLEVPSGILADRWSRKGVLMVSCVAFIVGSVLLGMSHTVLQYALSSILIGAHFALYSGMYDSIVYDTLLEETGSRKGYEKYFGNMTVLATVGIATGGLLSGVIGKKYGLSLDYYLSIPGSVVALVCLYIFKEPQLHKEVAKSKILTQFSDTLKIVLQKGERAWMLVSILGFGLVLDIVLQVGQLWALALALPLVLYGPLDALLLFGYSIGAFVAQKLSTRPKILILGLIAVCTTCLLTIRSMPVIALAQFVIVAVASAITIVLSGRLHDNLPSNLRSGSSSIVSTLKTLILIPVIFAFGLTTQKTSIFIASYIVVALAVLGFIGLIRLKLNRIT
jgi:MFS family permease